MKKLAIAIVDENKLLTIRLKLFLIQEELGSVKTYRSINELLEEKTGFDLTILKEEIFDYSLFEKLPDTIFLLISDEVKNTENSKIFYIDTNFTNAELKQEISIISFLKNYEKEVEEKNNKLKEALAYITNQEEMAANKQLNMIFDNMSFKKIENYYFDNYYSPKDKLSGDSYIAWHIDDKIYIVIIDAMGKGISASLTSTLTSGIGNYILQNNNSLKNFLENYIEYIKKILLDDEALCMTIFKLDLKCNEIEIANFGMPPIYIKKDYEVEKILTNNYPILKSSKREIVIDTYKKDFDMILISSDGLIESANKEGIPYFANLKSILPKTDFLREIIKDFKQNAIQDDDTTVYAIIKQQNNYEIIYEKSFFFSSKKDLDNIIHEIDVKLNEDETTKQKFYLIFQEIFLNIFEHAYRKNYDKQEILQKNQDFSDIKGEIHIKICKNEEYFNIIIKDQGRGFDVTNILKLENRNNFKRFHRRGLLVLLNIVCGLFFEDNGRIVHTFIRRKNGN